MKATVSSSSSWETDSILANQRINRFVWILVSLRVIFLVLTVVRLHSSAILRCEVCYRSWSTFQRCLLAEFSKRWWAIYRPDDGTSDSFSQTTQRNIAQDSHLCPSPCTQQPQKYSILDYMDSVQLINEPLVALFLHKFPNSKKRK
jgi:hypothetical protein